MTTIHSRIRAFLQDNFPTPDDLSDQQSLLQSGIIDSIGVLTLVTWMEQEFGFVVEDDDVVPENLDGVAALVAYIEGKLGSTGIPD
jgi:acyl carrier protein